MRGLDFKSKSVKNKETNQENTMFHLLVMLGTSFIVVQVIMLIFWAIYLVRRNVSIVDIAWGIGFVAVVLVYFMLGEGFIWRKVLVVTVVSIWAVRLVNHLALRFLPEQDDPRYHLLLRKWPYVNYPTFQVLTLFLLQGCLITILSLPFALMSQDELSYFSTYEVFGLLLWMVGVVGESVADRQLEQFKQNPANAGQVCDWGLWKYSRHPNYFFEWIVWVGFCLMALSAPWGLFSVISPILMFFLLVMGSGIPITEAHALEKKGDAYRDYQKRTSAFFPWFSHAKSVKPKEILKEEILPQTENQHPPV